MKCQIPMSTLFGINCNVPELDSVRVIKCQNQISPLLEETAASELEHVRVEKCQNQNMSELERITKKTVSFGAV